MMLGMIRVVQLAVLAQCTGTTLGVLLYTLCFSGYRIIRQLSNEETLKF